MAERERRARINLYVGPREMITRAALAALDAAGGWVCEEKHDGFWCCATVAEGEIVEMVSRTGVAFTGAETAGLVEEAGAGGEDLGLRLEGQCAVPLAALATFLLGFQATPVGHGRLVGELTADANAAGERCGTRRLHLFDVIEWGGIDLRGLPQTERREALTMIYGTLRPHDSRILLVEQREAGFAAWYDEIVARGGEGVVVKRKDTCYRAANADGKIDSWKRCKPGHSVDYVVIGPDGAAAKGTPKIALGLWKGTAAGRKLVKVMSPTWPRGMDLQPGMVVEVEGAEVFPSGAVRHGHIKRVRFDKRPEDCSL